MWNDFTGMVLIYTLYKIEDGVWLFELTDSLLCRSESAFIVKVQNMSQSVEASDEWCALRVYVQKESTFVPILNNAILMMGTHSAKSNLLILLVD